MRDELRIHELVLAGSLLIPAATSVCSEQAILLVGLVCKLIHCL